MYKPKIKARQPENYEKAYDYAIYLLNLQLRTSGELEYKMQDKGYAAEAIHKVLEELTASRYIDDLRYAEVYLENLKKYKTFGFYGIKKKLMAKRLPQNLIERVLAEGLSEEEELKIARRLMMKQEFRIKNQGEGPGNSPTEDGQVKIKQKIAQKLRARGFRSGVIAKLVF